MHTVANKYAVLQSRLTWSESSMAYEPVQYTTALKQASSLRVPQASSPTRKATAKCMLSSSRKMPNRPISTRARSRSTSVYPKQFLPDVRRRAAQAQRFRCDGGRLLECAGRRGTNRCALRSNLSPLLATGLRDSVRIFRVVSSLRRLPPSTEQMQQRCRTAGAWCRFKLRDGQQIQHEF